MPICSHQLTESQLTELKALEKRCKQHDGNTIPLYFNLLLQHRSLPCNLLYYHKNRLIGFLSVFFFFDDACEITVMVDPGFRRRHIALKLMATIFPVIQSRALPAIIFSSPKGLNTAWFTGRGFCYQQTEIHMLRKSSHPPKVILPNVILSKATYEDLPTLVTIHQACFHSNKEEIESRLMQLMNNPHYTLLTLHIDHQLIGKAHLLQNSDSIQLSDIAILPSFQGRGLGQTLVAHCIHYIHSTHALPIVLDVHSSNLGALHIYQKLGFKIMNTWELWKAMLSSVVS